MGRGRLGSRKRALDEHHQSQTHRSIAAKDGHHEELPHKPPFERGFSK